MVREIKFKIWDPVNGMGKSFYVNELPNIARVCLSYGEELENCVWLQYTGLKDKNNKEIYDGDIVEYSSVFGKNRQLGYVAYFNYRFLIRTDDFIVQDFGEPEFECEVMGNIYENSGLLGDTND